MVFVALIKLTASPPAPFDLVVSLDPVDAGYRRSSGPVARCLHGTRERLIEDVVQWVDSGSDHPICWLNGPAGSGKSSLFTRQYHIPLQNCATSTTDLPAVSFSFEVRETEAESRVSSLR